MRNIFILLFLLLLPTIVSGQCDFTINSTVVANSTCARNGIIKVTLSGNDIGNFNLTDAQYSIKNQTNPEHNTLPTANGGVIGDVPPGTYTVLVKAMCNRGNEWIEKESKTTITVTGNYKSPNPVEIILSGLKSSFKCDSSGVIRVKVSGGLPPYVLTAKTTTFVKAIPILSEGTFDLENLPAGNYTLELSDACGYFPSSVTITLNNVISDFRMGALTHTSICQKKGVIPITINSGKPPFTIKVEDGSTTNTEQILTTGTHNITNLTVGHYKVTVKDACNDSVVFNPEIQELKGVSSQSNLVNSAACGTGTGSIKLGFTGVSPFTINGFKNSALWGSFTEVTNTRTFNNLDAGQYLFQVIDSCGNTDTVNVTIKTVELKLNQNASPTNPTGCDGTGKATIKVESGKAPYQITHIDYTAGNVGTCTNSYTLPITIGNNYTLDNLCVGNYKVVVTDSCGTTDTVPFKIQPKPLKLKVINRVSTLDCAAIGEVTIEVSGGKPTYDLFYTKHPTAAVPFPAGTISTATGSIHISNLPKGVYEIAVNDQSCLVDTVNFQIDSVIIQGNLDLFEEFFYPTDTLDTNCKKVKAKMTNKAYNTFKQMINDSIMQVKFIVFDPITNVKKDSITVGLYNQSVDFALPAYTYKMMRDSGYQVRAILGSTVSLDCLNLAEDVIKLAPVKSIVKAITPSCSGFTISIEQNKGVNGVFCYPYKVSIVDRSINLSIKDSIGINNQNKFEIKNVPLGEYDVLFEDKEGYKWKDSAILDSWKNPGSITNNKYVELTCVDYKYQFNWKNVCYPYIWDLFDSQNNLIYTDTVNSNALQTTNILDYGEVYRLRVISPQNDTTEVQNITQNNTHDLVNYRIDSSYVSCIPDLGKGHIRIYRGAGAPAFTIGTVIKYISGPTIPTHTNIIASGGETAFFPFSANKAIAEKSDIAEGLYKFEVIDTCGFIKPLEVNFRHYKVVDFDFDLVDNCTDATVKPKATVLLGTDTITGVFFRIYETPATPITLVVGPGGGLRIEEEGTYKMQVSLSNATTSCPMETLEFVYSKDKAKVSFDKVKAYLCESGGGYIEFLVKGGIGDIRYSLLDPTAQNPLLPVKDTILPRGEVFKVYNYGELGVDYKIQFRDTRCSGAGGTETVVLSNLMNDRLIYGPERLCMGDTIKLYSDAPASTFSWTGPNGFTSSSANPVIPDAVAAHNGEYKLTVTNIVGCTGNLRRELSIDIETPAPPVADPLTIFCLDNRSETLTAVPDSGYNIKWYDANKNPLAHAPDISLSVVDTFTYYLTQSEESLSCASDTTMVKAQISDLPEPNRLVFSPEMCSNACPAIYIPNTTIGYIYHVYNSGGVLVAKDTAKTVDTLRLVGSEILLDTTTYTLNVVNENGCYSLAHSFQINVLDTTRNLIAGPDKICLFDKLELTSTNLGDSAIYNWSGPNSWVSNMQNPFIDSAKLENAGEYKLSVQLYGCNTPIQKAVSVDVLYPKAPVVAQPFIFCQFDTVNSQGLQINIPTNHTAQWYDNGNNPISAPIPSTLAEDTINYFVTHIYDSPSCEGARTAVEVIVSPLPTSEVKPFAPEMCTDAFPKIFIPDVKSNFTYNIYNESGVKVATKTSTGTDTIVVFGNEKLYDSTRYTIQVLNEHRCASAYNTQFAVNTIDQNGRIIWSDDKICLFDKLELKSLDLGDSVIYNWSGPNNWSSNLQNPFIDSAKVENTGKYKLRVDLYGCPATIEKTVDVKVLYPDAPIVAQPFIFCQFDTINSQGLQIDIPANHTAQWYDNGNNPISAPIPSTLAEDTINYFVTHVYDSPSCEGARTTVEVIVSPLPTSEVKPFAPEMCTDAFPKIFIPNVKNDFTYNIYNEYGVKVATKTSTGTDTIIVFGNEKLYDTTNYTIQVLNEHRCASEFNTQFPINTIDQNGKIIWGTEKICLFDKLELTSLDLGDSIIYNWSGPNNWSSNLQNPFIDSAKVENTGEYKLRVDLYGCPETIEKTVDVKVIYPDAPIVAQPFIFCQYDGIDPLKIDIPENHMVQWYNENEVPINVPQPSTNVGDTINYFVAHIYTNPVCQGAKTPVQAIISPRPTSDLEAYAPDICPGIPPKIFIPNAEIDYTYSIYKQSGSLLQAEKSEIQDTLLVIGAEKLYNSTQYFLEVANEHSCFSLDKTQFNVTIVDYMEMGPEKIPAYARNKRYSTFLTTNAHEPYVFRTNDELPATLQLSTQGEIYGLPPRDGYIAPGTFTIEVEDVDGCIKERTYHLESELFVPQIITPNDDGFNDYFMKGYRLIIFDRLGLKVFDGDDGWDGTYKGQPAPPDTYFYVIFYEGETGKELRKEGYVTVLKRGL